MGPINARIAHRGSGSTFCKFKVAIDVGMGEIHWIRPEICGTKFPMVHTPCSQRPTRNARYMQKFVAPEPARCQSCILAMLAFIVLASLCALVYIGARAYLVVEAFISVRSLPLGAYDNVNWAQLLVHFQ